MRGANFNFITRRSSTSAGFPTAPARQRNYSWLFFPAPIGAFGALLYIFNNNFSLLIPAVIVGCVASLLRNSFLDLLKGLVIGSVVTTIVLYYGGGATADSIIPTFAILMLFYLGGGGFAWWFVNTLKRMARRKK